MTQLPSDAEKESRAITPIQQPQQTFEESPEAVFVAEEIYRERRSTAAKGLLGCIAALLLVLAIVLLLPTIIGVSAFNKIISEITSVFEPQPSTAHTVSTQTILNGIQPLGQLVTISSQLAKADIRVGIGAGQWNACGFSAAHVAQGAVEGGIDLTQITSENITYDALSDTYTLTLPAPQLTSCRVDFIRQYDRSTTICNVDWDEARLLAQYVALTDFREDALEGGILNRAAIETQLVIGNFVTALTGGKVEIEIAEATSSTMPASCIGQLPQGWSFNEINQQWIKQ